MLTPAELLNGISQNPLPNARPETNNIDIHIHTFLHSNSNNPAEAQNLNSNINNFNNNNVSNQSILFLIYKHNFHSRFCRNTNDPI